MICDFCDLTLPHTHDPEVFSRGSPTLIPYLQRRVERITATVQRHEAELREARFTLDHAMAALAEARHPARVAKLKSHGLPVAGNQFRSGKVAK